MVRKARTPLQPFACEVDGRMCVLFVLRYRRERWLEATSVRISCVGVFLAFQKSPHYSVQPFLMRSIMDRCEVGRCSIVRKDVQV